MNSITQDMRFRQSILDFARKYGVSRASRKFNKSRSYIYFWLQRYDGSISSLACRSRKPHSHPSQHSEKELSLLQNMRRRNPRLGLVEFWFRLQKRGYLRSLSSLFRVMKQLNLFPQKSKKKAYKPKPYQSMSHPGERVQIDVKVVPRSCLANPEQPLFQYTAIDEFTRLRYIQAYDEQSTYTSACFLQEAVRWFHRKGIRIECVQTDNGTEFTNRFVSAKKNIPSLFEKTAALLDIRHKLIRPYTPRHNGKVERSHREDQKRFYQTHSFYSLQDFSAQLKRYLRRSNNMPMRPLQWISPLDFLRQFKRNTVQNV